MAKDQPESSDAEVRISTIPIEPEPHDRPSVVIPFAALVPAAPESPADLRGKDYEQLPGASGREVFFRPTRYRRDEFGDILPIIDVTFGGPGRPCELEDISQNGVAFAWPFEPTMTVGGVIPRLVIRFDEHDAYEGEAVVSSVRDVEGRCVIGASFVDSLMNIDDVLHLRDVRKWSLGDAQMLSASSRPWFAEGHDRFKSLVGELRLFFEDADARLTALEATLPAHMLTGEMHTSARAAIISQLNRDFVPEFLRYSEAIDAALRGANEADWQRLKDFSQRYLHAYLMRAPFMYRCRAKPLGYPGDFEVMRYLYESPFEGATLFGRALHLAVTRTRGAQAVVSRKDLMKSRINALLDRAPRDRPLRIASIAAGPAQEVFEVLAERKHLPRVEFLLFDQDRLALGFAQRRISRHVTQAPNVKVIYLLDSIKRLLHDSTLFKGFGPFDMIFCAGLFDYLQPTTAASLCHHFFDNLRPGGVAYVGNMVKENPCKWFLEHHLEWYLKLRTRQEMLDYAHQGVPEAQIGMIEDATGINPFLTFTKPG